MSHITCHTSLGITCNTSWGITCHTFYKFHSFTCPFPMWWDFKPSRSQKQHESYKTALVIY